MNKQITDQDLAPIYRTEANYFKMKYLEALIEIKILNRALRKKHRLIKALKEKEQ